MWRLVKSQKRPFFFQNNIFLNKYYLYNLDIDNNY